jgi:hypothetical protein
MDLRKEKNKFARKGGKFMRKRYIMGEEGEQVIVKFQLSMVGRI